MARQAGVGRPVSAHSLPIADWPVVLSIPHAGREYPADLLGGARVALKELQRLSDPWCDLLGVFLLARGAQVVKANWLRAVVDCNRNEAEMDTVDVEPALRPRFGPPGRKARAGLGVVPTRLGGAGALWRVPIAAKDFDARLNAMHRPFHRLLSENIDRLLSRHGTVLLIDLHSMPSLAPTRRDPTPPSIVVGDRFGRTAAAGLAQIFCEPPCGHPLPIALNSPYAGGHIIASHGRPALGVHALQVEFDRRLYLTHDGFPDPDAVIFWSEWLCERVSAAIHWLTNDLPMAAE